MPNALHVTSNSLTSILRLDRQQAIHHPDCISKLAMIPTLPATYLDELSTLHNSTRPGIFPGQRRSRHLIREYRIGRQSFKDLFSLAQSLFAAPQEDGKGSFGDVVADVAAVHLGDGIRPCDVAMAVYTPSIFGFASQVRPASHHGVESIAEARGDRIVTEVRSSRLRRGITEKCRSRSCPTPRSFSATFTTRKERIDMQCALFPGFGMPNAMPLWPD